MRARALIMGSEVHKSNNTNFAVYFGDGDTALFADATKAWFNTRRRDCDAVLATPGTANTYYWVSTGCSSFWTLRAIESFCDFVMQVYANPKYHKFLRMKADRGSSVVDMSLLWLWNVRSMPANATGFQTGEPWHSLNPLMSAVAFRQAYGSAWSFTKNLLKNMPTESYNASDSVMMGANMQITSPLLVCNGLDVVQRTVLDHMRGWSDGASPKLPLSTVSQFPDAAYLGCANGCPSVVADSLKSGGVPESTDRAAVASLAGRPLYLLSLHYQVRYYDS